MSRNENQNSRPMLPITSRKPPDEMILSLCSACAQQFYDSPEHKIRRADYQEVIKQECDYCAVRRGFSFVISGKKS